MLVALCAVIAEVFCIVVYRISFGQLTGLFANESFGNSCDSQMNNSISSIMDNVTYLGDIDEFSQFSNISLNKYTIIKYISFYHALLSFPFRQFFLVLDNVILET